MHSQPSKLADQLERSMHVDPGGVEIVFAGIDTGLGCSNYDRFMPSLHESEWTNIRLAQVESNQPIAWLAEAGADAVRMLRSVSAQQMPADKTARSYNRCLHVTRSWGEQLRPFHVLLSPAVEALSMYDQARSAVS